MNSLIVISKQQYSFSKYDEYLFWSGWYKVEFHYVTVHSIRLELHMNKRIAYNDKVSLRYSVKAKNSNNDNVYLTCSESNKIAKENI